MSRQDSGQRQRQQGGNQADDDFEEEPVRWRRWDDLSEDEKYRIVRFLYMYLCFWFGWMLFTLSDWKEWWSSFKQTAKELKTRLSTPYELMAKILRLLFFLFQFLYPLVLFLLDIEHLPFNVTCLVVSFLGMVKDMFEVGRELHKLYRDYRESKKREEEYGLEEAKHQVRETDDLEALFRDHVKEVCLDLLEEVFIYPAIICDVFGFVNGRVYEFNRTTDYVDAILLAYGLFVDLVIQQGRRVVLLYRTWKALCNAYNSAKSRFCCICCCNPKGVIPCFIVQFSLLSVAHILLISLVGLQCLYDNRENFDYSTTLQSRTLIAAGVGLPFVNIIMYVLMNKVSIYELFLNIKREKNPNYKNKRLESVTNKTCCQKFKAPFADVKAVAFGCLYLYLITYSVVFSNITSPTPAPTLAGSTTNTTTTTILPALDGASDVTPGIQIALAVVLFLSNPQAAVFGLYLVIIGIYLSPFVVIIIVCPWLLIPACVCAACAAVKKKGCTASILLICHFFKGLWHSLIT